MYAQRINGETTLYSSALQQYFTASSPEHIQQHQQSNVITSVAGNHMWSTGKREFDNVADEGETRVRVYPPSDDLRYSTSFLFFGPVVSEDGVGEGYSPTSAGSGNKQQQSNNNNGGGGGLPAFAQRFATPAASAYAAAGGPSSRASSYHPIASSGVMPYHVTTAAAINNSGGTSSSAADVSSLQWAAVAASHGYPNTDGTINYVPIPNSQVRSRSNASFSAAASLSAREYCYSILFLSLYAYCCLFFSYIIICERRTTTTTTLLALGSRFSSFFV